MYKTHLPEFEGIFFKESYFLGLVAEATDLELKCLFALKIQHPKYITPMADELHYYCAGKILLRRPKILKWRAGRPELMRDAAGRWEFGRIEVDRLGENRFRFGTEWFDAAIETEHLAVELSHSHGC